MCNVNVPSQMYYIERIHFISETLLRKVWTVKSLRLYDNM